MAWVVFASRYCSASRQCSDTINQTCNSDFGGDLTVAAFTAKINGFTTRLGTYNEHVAALDDEQNAVDAEEEELRDWNSRWLSAIEAKHGRDSSEYELAGGTRTRDRKKPKKGGGGKPPKP